MNNKAKINKKISLQTNAARADFQSRRRGCPSRTEDSLVLQNSLQAADQDRDREKRRRLSLSTDRLSHRVTVYFCRMALLGKKSPAIICRNLSRLPKGQ